MRADRLLALIMLLQTKKQWTAGVLAERLEVSERTVYRDLDALSAMGVPVFATRGSTGGVGLEEGWRTELTGLTRKEIHALAAVGEARALEALDLLGPLRSGMSKLAVSLPGVQKSVIEFARQRLHVDPAPFFAEPEPVPHLELLREATWQNRRVRIGYRDFDGKRTRRVVDPYGLAVKSDRWYLVAADAKGAAVFRGGRIESARLLEETFERPDGFDLPTFWRQWCARFHEKRATYEVTLRVTKAGAEKLAAIRPARDRNAITNSPAGRGGRRDVVIDFEREDIAVAQLAQLGPGAEVIGPEGLRKRLMELGRHLVAAHR